MTRKHTSVNGYVCVECGVKHLTEHQKKRGSVTTFHKGECIKCKRTKLVTSTRHYNYLRKIK